VHGSVVYVDLLCNVDLLSNVDLLWIFVTLTCLEQGAFVTLTCFGFLRAFELQIFFWSIPESTAYENLSHLGIEQLPLQVP
jgi:hypothetical protein